MICRDTPKRFSQHDNTSRDRALPVGEAPRRDARPLRTRLGVHDAVREQRVAAVGKPARRAHRAPVFGAGGARAPPTQPLQANKGGASLREPHTVQTKHIVHALPQRNTC